MKTNEFVWPRQGPTLSDFDIACRSHQFRDKWLRCWIIRVVLDPSGDVPLRLIFVRQGKIVIFV